MPGIPTTALLAVFSPAALAAIPPAYQQHLPPETRVGEVRFLGGGRTPEEAAAIRRAAQEFPLQVVFTEETGGDDRPLHDVPLAILDAGGNVVFEGVSGPYFLAELPPGDYRVEARWRDWTFTAPVTIGDGEARDRIVFSWRPVEHAVERDVYVVRPAPEGPAAPR